YGCEFIKKNCYRLCFFSKEFSDFESADLVNDDFLGYCIIQTDSFINKNKQSTSRTYVTESVTHVPKDKPYNEEQFTYYGSHRAVQTINGKRFAVNGNYFSQQNGITNCCANAAIKMAFRGKYSEITAEKINEAAGVDHKTKLGRAGLDAKEISNVINRMTTQKSYLLKSDDLEKLQFIKIIYHAVESRLPVILLLSKPEEASDPDLQQEPEGIQGHSVAIMGHTSNNHNWWYYGLKFYFTKSKQLKYLPSLLWCDNFVVQDDNMGPYYFLPVGFFASMVPVKGKICKFIINSILRLSAPIPLELWNYEPVHVVVSYPEELEFFKHTVSEVEPRVILHVDLFVNLLKEKENEVLRSPSFISYFYSFYNEGSLILRSFVIGKEEYINCLKENDQLCEYKNILEQFLPDHFWVTEISIPELFWINKKKVGEVISDPRKIENSDGGGIIFMHLPEIICFVIDGTPQPYRIEKKYVNSALIRPQGKGVEDNF
ncbi:MAG: hypothetical protein OEY89_18565, partial [Gammaproteobacteria bacterium]|nr:hypothetical protein [Gammaproteobacteria bacterium]